MLYYNNNYALFIFEFQARIKKTTNSPLHFLNVGAVIVQNLEATYYLLAASGSEGAGGLCCIGHYCGGGYCGGGYWVAQGIKKAPSGAFTLMTNRYF